MPLTKNEISDMILSAFPDATLELKDTMGDNNHFEAKIIYKNFEKKFKKNGLDIKEVKYIKYLLQSWVPKEIKEKCCKFLFKK